MCSSLARTDRPSNGFTLLELLLAVSILAAITAVTFVCFGIVTSAWQRGIALADDLHHGDFVMDQLVSGLRSAYFPEKKSARSGTYGFWLEDTADGSYAEDAISWVKLGSALVGKDCAFRGSAHRVVVTVARDDDGDDAAALRAWQIIGQPKDFDPEDVEYTFLSKRVVGLDCRCAIKLDDGGIDWEDEWVDELTNKLPRFVELTLYLDPLEEGDSPIEIRRLVEIPVAHLSW